MIAGLINLTVGITLLFLIAMDVLPAYFHMPMALVAAIWVATLFVHVLWSE